MPSHSTVRIPEALFPDTIPHFLHCESCHCVPLRPVPVAGERQGGKMRQQQVRCQECGGNRSCSNSNSSNSNSSNNRGSGDGEGCVSRRRPLNESTSKQWSSIPVRCPHEQCGWVGPIGRYECHVSDCHERRKSVGDSSASSGGSIERSFDAMLELKCMLWDAAARNNFPVRRRRHSATSKKNPTSSRQKPSHSSSLQTGRLFPSQRPAKISDSRRAKTVAVLPSAETVPAHALYSHAEIDGTGRKMKRRGGIVSPASGPKKSVSSYKCPLMSTKTKKTKSTNNGPKRQIRRPSIQNMRSGRRVSFVG